MQSSALREDGQELTALEALRHKDYFCKDCLQALRLRKGLHRQAHFFHIKPNQFCSQSKKSLTHLAIQKYIRSCIGKNLVQIEVRFPQIQRIADLVWEKEKIIFEVQCSRISAQEVKCRNQDYASIGYQVIWILHDKRFKQKRVSAAEIYLKKHPHYYCHFDHAGKSFVYDQVLVQKHGLQSFRSKKNPIEFEVYKRQNPLNSSLFLSLFQNFYQRHDLISLRKQHWPVFLKGSITVMQEDKKKAEGVKLLRLKIFFSWVCVPFISFYRSCLESCCWKKSALMDDFRR